MRTILTFPEQLRLIDERSAAFRAAVAAAPSLDVQMPTHPSRTLFDHVHHVGMGRRKAAAIVAAGAADGPPEKSVWGGGTAAPREREALLFWWVESVEHLSSVLQEAGPDRPCWTWWDDSPSPQTSGAWARRQLHEIAVHTYDVQLVGGAPRPIPEEIALDGFDDCQFTLCATTVAWPHEPAIVDYHAAEGHSWRLRLSHDGAQVARLAPAAGGNPDAADVSARGTASDLVLFFYGRPPLDSLEFDGDRRVLDRLAAWDPSA
ncbi:maleylpyruvate isomerase N-terminal domain-containing protein [Herbiconiux sp. CPCC 205763]|uniref:Maleylpyruvate isomerase N-terminal domain-containing protein n=1 Tax=Herbiconiux aconitum TaxID=2970913 RepID=A0ABT2GNG5_9MICO|nr:maleylpyruvate isomerase N-terminal domain-containing protein [Herbiconiux aconitum]MCS5717772.1 maleylpyruvate isomerase N-terminal domain-containing protein [Herbiconiux aconitum]